MSDGSYLLITCHRSFRIADDPRSSFLARRTRKGRNRIRRVAITHGDTCRIIGIVSIKIRRGIEERDFFSQHLFLAARIIFSSRFVLNFIARARAIIDKFRSDLAARLKRAYASRRLRFAAVTVPRNSQMGEKLRRYER